jgi:hypothetical protein
LFISLPESRETHGETPMKKRWLILPIAVLFPMCFCLGMRVYVDVGQRDFAEALTRTGMEPTTDGLVAYIEQSVSVGMTREQVEAALGKLMPIRVHRRGTPMSSDPYQGSVVCDEVLLVYGRLPGQTYSLIPCYAADGSLLRAKFTSADMPMISLR